MRTRGVIAAGLAQLGLLLLAFWAVRPGPTWQNHLLSASLLGLSLLPVGFSVRLSWLRVVAVAWWVVFLILSVQYGRPGGSGADVDALGRLALALAGLAAAAGQWLLLERLPLGRVGAVARDTTRPLIGLCAVLLLAFLHGGTGLLVALILFFGTLADLALTALIYLLAVLAEVRRARLAKTEGPRPPATPPEVR